MGTYTLLRERDNQHSAIFLFAQLILLLLVWTLDMWLFYCNLLYGYWLDMWTCLY
ncbi:hypothetical protein PAHAL_4G009300 [Panicum hallii]|uniref:Uncharacterized protein n=1 Tax=Panicum hallii TaxID=206008 RepID=A0A2T8JBE0_9POAL|nr:hypothetical protein PAHAL_4G009300 [Panicum hallii]